MKYLIEVFDPKTECIVEEMGFEDDQTEELLSILGLESFDQNSVYELDTKQIQRINARYQLNIDSGATLVKLSMRSVLDDLPYKLHTDRELVLMLAGEKPLGVFTDFAEDFERKFDPYVEAGRFVKDEYIKPVHPGSAIMIRRVFYALPEESWRINAFILMLKTAAKAGWSGGFERMEGSLLGYTDEQNDIWIKFRQTRAQQVQNQA